jgi:hypothetical protein
MRDEKIGSDGVQIAPGRANPERVTMKRASSFELFAAFAAQFPLLTRDDLESIVELERGSPSWERAVAHARQQAAALGLSFAAEEEGGSKEGVIAEGEIAPVFPPI